MSFHVTHMYPFEASWGNINAAAETGLDDLEGKPGFPPEPQGSRTIVLDSASTSSSPTQSSQNNPLPSNCRCRSRSERWLDMRSGQNGAPRVRQPCERQQSALSGHGLRTSEWPVSDVNLTFRRGLWDRHRGLPGLPRGGAVRILARIEHPVVIKNILEHHDAKALKREQSICPPSGRRARVDCCTARVSSHDMWATTPAVPPRPRPVMFPAFTEEPKGDHAGPRSTSL